MASPKDQLPPLGEVIERIGFGWAQLRTSLLGGCVWLADGSELLLIGTVTKAVSDEWHMSAWQRGSVVSVVFIGILIGNAICGPLGDNQGRRLPILISYVGIFIFSVISAMSQDFYQLAIVRLFVGASFGIGQPAINALCSEVSPNKWRIVMNAFTQTLFIVGELYSAILVWSDDPSMRSLDWRWLLLMGALPSLVCLVFSYFFLLQSPSYFAVHGEYESALEVLESMKHDNGAVDVVVDFKPLPPKKPSTHLEATLNPIAVIFSRRLFYSTVAVIYSTFTLNVLFYGCLYAFPQVVKDIEMGTSPAVSLIIGALWEFPGNVLATAFGMYWPRKPVMLGYLLVTILSLIAFSVGAQQRIDNKGPPQLGAELLLQGGYMGIKAFAQVGFVAVYQYSAEIYPTVSRTTGTAACVAGGRLGGMLAPLIFEWLLEYTGSLLTFFYFVASLCGFNLILVAFLPFETFGKSLEDNEDETCPINVH
eukprot:TRINITY_DN58420_c0_g1_i1.p1 TRINITY_DN58420_c0_g1~~TRINITY_DN58420_c0_g1_i1.p1  ORF type:complete len:479 (+),score=77.40 TRINITY_DN58420_c0_g1_i1:86-1522(+)